MALAAWVPAGDDRAETPRQARLRYPGPSPVTLEDHRQTDDLKVLVASRRGQGLRSDDYYCLTDGELVYLGLVCDSGVGEDICGCGRGFAGCQSQRAGTTATVAIWPGSRADYTAAIGEALVHDGYIEAGDPHGLAGSVAEDMLQLVADFPVGAVVERRVDVVRPRLGA